jgi:hypothetical protein
MRSADKKEVRSFALAMGIAAAIGAAGISLLVNAVSAAVLAALK